MYLISSLSDDSSIDSIKNLRRIKLSPAFLGEDILATEFKNSLVIFDDCEAHLDFLIKFPN